MSETVTIANAAKRNTVPPKHLQYTQSRLNADRIDPGKFNIIYADPPWRYANWSMSEQAIRGEKWARRNGRSPYPVMRTDDIAALPVQDIVAKDAILLMWVTDPKLVDGLEVIDAWGFCYRTVGFTWVKQNPSGIGFHFGLGFHTRSNPEQCLIAKRRKGLRRSDNSVPQLLIAPRSEHSRKPDETYSRIERLYGDVPRVELFARRSVPGWTAIGNEIDGQNIDEAIQDLANRSPK